METREMTLRREAMREAEKAARLKAIAERILTPDLSHNAIHPD